MGRRAILEMVERVGPIIRMALLAQAEAEVGRREDCTVEKILVAGWACWEKGQMAAKTNVVLDTPAQAVWERSMEAVLQDDADIAV